MKEGQGNIEGQLRRTSRVFCIFHYEKYASIDLETRAEGRLKVGVVENGAGI